MAEDAPDGDDEDAMEVDDEAAVPSAASRAAQIAAANVRKAARLGGDSGAREALEAVLDEIPHVLPFQDRVVLLHNVILVDQDNREDTRAPWARSSLPGHQIRRTSLFEDGFAAFSRLDDEDALRSIFKVEFLAPDGTPEQGIDGGGLFKEFMIHICREAFDPLFG